MSDQTELDADNAVARIDYDGSASPDRAKVMSRMRGTCDNCGEPMMAHCQRHLIPCCPHYSQHEQAHAAVASLDVLHIVNIEEDVTPDQVKWFRRGWAAYAEAVKGGEE